MARNMMFSSLAFLITSAAGAIPHPTVFWKNATLDWFRFTPDQGVEAHPATFAQRVLVSDAEWDSPRGPMLVFFGGEGPCEDFWDNSGALFAWAKQLRAKVVFLEHRYFGLSLPFGGRSFGDRELRFLTVEQALADMSDLLSRKAELLGCAPGATSCKAVLFGGSYGGMLVAWHRLKYPHLSSGGHAASAPVDLWPGENKSGAFLDATLYTYREYGSVACAAWIAEALGRLSASTNYPLLTSSFSTCKQVSGAEDAARLLMYVQGSLATVALLDYPVNTSFVTPVPASPVRYACDVVGPPPPTTSPAPARHAAGDGADAWLFASLNAVQNVLLNYTGVLACHNFSAELIKFPSVKEPTTMPTGHLTAPPPAAGLGGFLQQAAVVGNAAAGIGDIQRPWDYLACSSLILEPLTSGGFGFWVPQERQIPDVERACRAMFAGVSPRPGWLPVAYGNGAQLASSLRNVLFSDGDKDPWRIGSVPANASAYSPDGSVSHLLIRGAAHHEDFRSPDPADSPELVAGRATELEHFRKWLGGAAHAGGLSPGATQTYHI